MNREQRNKEELVGAFLDSESLDLLRPCFLVSWGQRGELNTNWSRFSVCIISNSLDQLRVKAQASPPPNGYFSHFAKVKWLCVNYFVCGMPLMVTYCYSYRSLCWKHSWMGFFVHILSVQTWTSNCWHLSNWTNEHQTKKSILNNFIVQLYQGQTQLPDCASTSHVSRTAFE